MFRLRGLLAGLALFAAHRCRSRRRRSSRQERRADQDRVRHGSDRRAGRGRQGGAAGDEDLGRGDQRQGRAARPAGQADLLRRPEQPGDGPRHLHEAARRRQGRYRRQRLRHQPDRAGDADRDPEGQDLLLAVRPRREQRVPIPEILLDAAGRRRRPAGAAFRRDFSSWRRRRTRSRKPSRSSPATPNSRATPPTARARTRRKPGFKVVYDKTYPPNTTDYTPIVRAIDATSADLVISFSYPPDAVGMVRAANEIGLKAKMFGGGLVGLQYASIKQQLGEQLNGIVNYDFWEPAKTLQFPGRGRIPEEIPGARRGGRGRSARLLPAAVRLRQHAGDRAGGRGRRRASTTTSSPTGSGTTRSRRSSAISNTARTASGRSRAFCRCSSTTSKAATSISGRPTRSRRSCGRINTRPARSIIPTPRRKRAAARRRPRPRRAAARNSDCRFRREARVKPSRGVGNEAGSPGPLPAPEG